MHQCIKIRYSIHFGYCIRTLAHLIWFSKVWINTFFLDPICLLFLVAMFLSPLYLGWGHQFIVAIHLKYHFIKLFLFSFSISLSNLTRVRLRNGLSWIPLSFINRIIWPTSFHLLHTVSRYCLRFSLGYGYADSGHILLKFPHVYHIKLHWCKISVIFPSIMDLGTIPSRFGLFFVLHALTWYLFSMQ